ncbi:glycoside hydrolase family 105 protein [Parabacteroides sp. FAFU027]|uniref:glycoside hydrolase family 88/105 protein n=1 Tax=Parabacteroides sp. FAFU027 TaxID=2922715 RepID=UPI001FAF7563|nr:glycoside hydrolase family 88 protein [Parabacteroides sp. FAFU027]
MKKALLALFVLGTIIPTVFSQKTDSVALKAAVSIADRIIRSTPYEFINTKTKETYTTVKGLPLSPDVKVKSEYNDWHYTNGIMYLGMMELGQKLNEPKYRNYVQKNMDFVFNEGNLDYFKQLYDQAIKQDDPWNKVRRLSFHMIFRNKRLDDNGTMGASLIELYKTKKDAAYYKYIQTANEHLLYFEPRLADGLIARIWPHEKTVWADDIYMGVSFLCRMGSLTGDVKYFDDAANQVLSVNKYLWCKEKQIYYHCYHTDVKENGVAHWGRANGWIAMAHADLLTYMPKNHPKRQAVIDNFKQQMAGVCRYQGKNGLWHQLLDKEDSYDETTCTAMFVYALAKGVKNGWLHKDYIHVANSGFRGMMTMINDKGDVSGICTGTGIMPSLSFYYNRPTESNTMMGEGPVLRALVEMIDAPKYTEINANEQYAKIVDRRIKK